MCKTTTYYLSSDFCSDKLLCFSAKFSSSCQIKNCYIIASDLMEALMILYRKLGPIWSCAYIDNHLLGINLTSL